jgi:hypothetical protein
MPQPLAHNADTIRQNDPLQVVYAVRWGSGTEGLPAPVRRILGLFDGQRTTARVVQDARISEARGLAVIRKLTLAGVLQPVWEDLERADTLRDLPSHREIQRQCFTPEEEAFFASEVEPDIDLEPSPSLGERVGLYLADLRMRLTGAPA